MQTIKTIFILIVLIAVFSFFAVPSASAQTGQHFGGFVYYTFYCTCSFNWLIFVSPPKFGFFSYMYTPQFSNYMLPLSGVWTLGNYSSGGQCLIYVGTGCSTFIPPTGIITPIVGTSF